MRRREFLATLAISGIAGCVDSGSAEKSGKTETERGAFPAESSGDSESSGTPRSSATGESQPGTATTGSEASPRSAAAPETVVGHPFEVTLEAWWGEKSLRYYDNSDEKLKLLEPTRSWWLQPRVRVSNIGSQTATRPEISDFSVANGDMLSSPVREFEETERDRIRQPSDSNIIAIDFPGDHRTTGELQGGGEVVYGPLFDVGRVEGLSLGWETGDGIEHLSTDVVHLGD